MSVDFVVGEVGFGSNLEPESDFYKARCEQLELQIKDLEARLAKKQRHVNILRRILPKCAALAPEIADEKHEALLETAPENR